MKLDLHIHSHASDGACSPAEVVERAVAGGLDVIALADHDTVAGVRPAMKAARGLPIQVIPAVEMSSAIGGKDIHILAYLVDLDSLALTALARRGTERRAARMAEMVERLARRGVMVTHERLEAQRASPATAFVRPHLARALVASGYAASVPDAFARFIGEGCPAYVPTKIAKPREVIEAALAAGGVPVWAHPPARTWQDHLPELVRAGLAGLEVFRPPGRSASVTSLEDAARRHRLLMTGGSDWHGPAAGTRLGDFYVRAEDVQPFLAKAGM